MSKNLKKEVIGGFDNYDIERNNLVSLIRFLEDKKREFEDRGYREITISQNDDFDCIRFDFIGSRPETEDEEFIRLAEEKRMEMIRQNRAKQEEEAERALFEKLRQKFT